MALLKPCTEPGCPVPVEKGRCTKHARDHERRRGSRQDRGYTAEYDRLHRDYQRRMDNGERFVCWRCEDEKGVKHDVDPRPGRWHLGHADDDRSIIRGPECPAGNIAAGSRRRNGHRGHNPSQGVHLRTSGERHSSRREILDFCTPGVTTLRRVL